ncbi:serine/threonine-protein phosphatase (plasmid) [Streptomyces sp. NBC_01340]|uniref:PP2C family protein-serine/threonine phosphatase n=1 Tax=unclassified Streptomyces TaxID=2593676 RepID=UPI00224CDC17|nr:MULTISPECIES: PP2C family protein-serine/threonine phosphatase [unclassified Streptomyces]MCX4461104.1 serine/threonine-protein phosphatase [Streptomyces sp. NBC_01719]MCX4499567.1 serine/threonine-protein phosphatase [Streptomyces sp. NBC_01728]WSI44738.1 serine/threonine-protein phosphatase [Streptomyces sp. NBC_01340]
MRSLFRSSPGPGAGGHSRVLFTLVQRVPFMIALGVLGIELSPAHAMVTGPVLTAVPALAALTMGPKGTLAAVCAALAVNVTTATYNQAWGTHQVSGNFLGLLVVSMASVMLSNAVRTRRQSELDQVRRIAVAAQELILRPVPARLGPVRAASLCLAAGTGAQIGGDLYEAVQTRYGVRLIVGDVRGKGLNAMRAVAVVLGAFREAVHYEDELVEVVNHCAAALQREAAVPGAFDEEALMEGFTTALLAEVPDDEPVVHVVNRGHPPPLMLHQGTVQALMPVYPLPPFGLEDLITGPSVKPESYPFLPGDRLLLYPDGVIEARNHDNDFFTLPEAMEGMQADTPHEFLEQLHQQLTHHTEDRLADDVAMILLDRLNEEADRAPGKPGTAH